MVVQHYRAVLTRACATCMSTSPAPPLCKVCPRAVPLGGEKRFQVSGGETGTLWCTPRILRPLPREQKRSSRRSRDRGCVYCLQDPRKKKLDSGDQVGPIVSACSGTGSPSIAATGNRSGSAIFRQAPVFVEMAPHKSKGNGSSPPTVHAHQDTTWTQPTVYPTALRRHATSPPQMVGLRRSGLSQCTHDVPVRLPG